MTNKKLLLMGGIVIITAVIIGAGVYMTKRPVQVAEIPKPEIPEETDTSDWKTYRNEEYGYEIKYPADWYTYEDMGNRIISTFSEDVLSKAEECEDLGGNSAEIILRREDGSIESKLEMIKLYHEKIMRGVVTTIKIDEPIVKEIVIEGENGYRISLNYYEHSIMCEEGTHIIYLFPDKNSKRFFHFEGDFRGKNREIYKKYAEKFDQMLSTFRFLE